MQSNQNELLVLILLIFQLSCSMPSTDDLKPFNPINQEQADVVIKNVNIIPMTSETVIENQSVYVSNGIIQQIGLFDTLSVPAETTVIEAEGKFLLPGFSDMHTHLNYHQELSLALANGVTTMRNMWGYSELLEAREQIKRGELLGPHIYTTGPLTDGAGAYWPGTTILTDVNKVKEYVTKVINDGYDFIKVYDKLDADVFNKIMEEANAQGIQVVGHVPKSVSIIEAINAGMKSIEHFVGYDLTKPINEMPEVIKSTLASEIWNCPTIIVFRNYKSLLISSEKIALESMPELKYVHPDDISWWQSRVGYNEPVEEIKLLLDNLYNAGANIVSGTDFGNPYIIAGFSLHEEFELMYDAGLTPYEVLLTSTVNPAKMLGIENQTGTIEVGKNADLVLLDKNPLEDISNTKTISAVAVQGKWLDRETLNELLKQVEESYSKM